MEEGKDTRASDVLRWLLLTSEEQLYRSEIDDVVQSVKRTWKMFVIWTLTSAVLAVVYMCAASYEFNYVSHGGPLSSEFRALSFIWSLLLLFNIAMWSLVGARIGLYGVAAALIESVGLAILSFTTSAVSMVIPDRFEEWFDRSKTLETAIKEARANKTLTKFVGGILGGYFFAVTFMIGTCFLIYILPIRVYARPSAVVLSIIAIIFLIYAAVSWGKEVYWLPKIQNALMWAAAGYVIINLAIIPILEAIGFWNWNVVVVDGVAAETITPRVWFPPNFLSEANWFQIVIGGALLLGFLAILLNIVAGFIRKSRGEVKPVNFGGNTSPLGWLFVFSALFIVAFMLYYGASAVWAGLVEIGKPPAPYSAAKATPTPYVNKNPDLVKDGGYRFRGSNRLYIYDGEKLRPVQSDEAFVAYYRCHPGTLPDNCASILYVPFSVGKGERKIVGGEIIK